VVVQRAVWTGRSGIGLDVYYGMQASEPKIVEFLEHVGIQISEGEISNWLIQERERFHAEKDTVYEAGLASSPYQQTDDTLTRVNGQNQHCHVFCNPVYTAYHTRPSKESLLLVLQYPELPLHNNAAEQGVRQRVGKRDVSFGSRTQAGVRAWDTFATLAATSKKLGVSLYQYFHDRISGANRIPPMADLVTKAAKDLNLGWSFVPA
jgi:hypothetical protein